MRYSSCEGQLQTAVPSPNLAVSEEGAGNISEVLVEIFEYVIVKLQISSYKVLGQEQPHCSYEWETEVGLVE